MIGTLSQTERLKFVRVICPSDVRFENIESICRGHFRFAFFFLLIRSASSWGSSVGFTFS